MMFDRREFLVNSGVAVSAAGVAIMSGTNVTPLRLSNGEINVVLPKFAMTGKDKIASQTPETLSKRLNVKFADVVGPRDWAADNIQMHTRYFPSSEALMLPESENKDAVMTRVHGLRHFYTFDIIPYAMLINVSKLGANTPSALTLSTFKKSGIKPVLPINASGHSPENSWFLPLLYPYLKVGLEGDFAAYIESARGIQDLENFIRAQYSHYTVRMRYGTDDGDDYHALIDPKNDRVAFYGDPEKLARNIQQNSGLVGNSQFVVVGLQQFADLRRTPSFFASQMLQVGKNVSDKKVVNFAPHLLATIREIGLKDNLEHKIKQAPIRYHMSDGREGLRATHAPKHYQNIKNLNLQIDGNELGRLMVDIEAGLHCHKTVSKGGLTNVAKYVAACVADRQSKIARSPANQFIV